MFKFRKIASVLASAVMVSSTVALAAAANFPAPFVKNGSADVAIVYGEAQVGGTDLLAAADISNALQAQLASQTATGSTSGTTTASGGDFVNLQRGSSFLYLGNTTSTVFGRSITSDDLPELLADGTYRDDNSDDFDYTQKIEVSALKLQQFDDSDYKSDAPTVGVRIASNGDIFNYTLDFTDNPAFSTNLPDTDLSLMGKQYRILSKDNSTSTLTLLDSASSIVLAEGETKSVTVGSSKYDVSISFIATNQVKLTVNGQTTSTLREGGTYKLSDGSYLGVKDILVQDYQGGVKKVDFSIGSGKLVLQNNTNVKVNDNSVDGLTSLVLTDSAGALDRIVLKWTADGDTFITPSDSIEMPAFKGFKLSMTNMTYPTMEETSVENDGRDSVKLNTVVKSGDVELNILQVNSTGNYVTVGKDSTHILRTSSSTSLTFNKGTDEAFVASWASGKDAESYVLYATGFTTDNGVNKTTLKNKADSAYSKDVQKGDTVTLGNIVLTVGNIDKNNQTIDFTTNGEFNTLYTKAGLKVYLPFLSTTSGSTGALNVSANSTNPTYSGAYNLTFVEEDKDGNIGSGQTIRVRLGTTSDYYTKVAGIAASSYVSEDGNNRLQEIGNSNVYVGHVYSALATQVQHDQGPDQNTAKLIYHGGESYATLVLSAPGVVVSSSGSGVTTLGNPIIKDSEVASAAAKNLIVVGGSCVNTVAAQLLGSSTPLCGADFTAKTGIASGQFLIQTFDRTGGKVATLVAGYNAQDTSNAATYLKNNAVDTTVGKKYVGTSATSATLQTTTA